MPASPGSAGDGPLRPDRGGIECAQRSWWMGRSPSSASSVATSSKVSRVAVRTVRVRVSTRQSPRARRTVQATSARADRGSSGRIVKRSAATLCTVRSMSSYRWGPLSWVHSRVASPVMTSCRTTRSVRAGASAVTGRGGAVSTGGSGGSASSAGSGGRTGSVRALVPA